MCLLTYYPAGIPVDRDHLEQGALNNPDGHGWAIALPGEILTGHSLKDETAIEQFVAIRQAFPSAPAMFHSRIATAGTVTVDNCHPFLVNGDPQTVLAHNGILPLGAQPAKGDKRSDTRLLAEQWIPKGRFGNIRTRRERKQLRTWLGHGNKVLVLTVDPNLTHRENGSPRAFLLNGHLGDWVDGIWYSNSSHEYWYGKWSFRGNAVRTSGYGGYADAEWWKEQTRGWSGNSSTTVVNGSYSIPVREVCKVCEAVGAITQVSRVCSMCLHCANCQSFVDDCECWVDASPADNGDCAHRYPVEHGGFLCNGTPEEHGDTIKSHDYLSPEDAANAQSDTSDKDAPPAISTRAELAIPTCTYRYASKDGEGPGKGKRPGRVCGKPLSEHTLKMHAYKPATANAWYNPAD